MRGADPKATSGAAPSRDQRALADAVPLRPALASRPEPPESDDGLTLTRVILATTWTLGGLLFAWAFLNMVGVAIPPEIPAPYGPIDVAAAGLVLGLAPHGFHAAREARRIRNIEDRFPDFLRDLAANKRAGIPLAASVELAAEADYGALTPEIETMAAQLSWNVPFEEVLERFTARVDTPLVHRATTLILEAEYAGGRITDVLDAVARDVRALRTLKNERRSTMTMYTIVVYITFLVFLGVAAMLYTQFLPDLIAATSARGDLPTRGVEAFSGSAITLEDYRQFFYASSLVQALGSGVLAGVMAHGDIGPGLRHAAVMTLVAAACFTVLFI